jgi:hypothetical protein
MVPTDTPMSRTRAFQGWYEKAAVRTGPRRLVSAGDAGVFFPEHLVPHLSHPLIDPDDAPLRRYLAAQHLYQWLQFTMEFEVAVVCRATQHIADGSSGLVLPPESRLDAARITVDESYHSLYSLDVSQQLQESSGIGALPVDFGPFFAGLDAIGDDMPQHSVLIRLLQVVVFETLITSVLSDIPQDESLIELVRVVVRDHAADEARHHAFFSVFFQHLWGQLEPSLRRQIASYLPRLIVASLQPPSVPAVAALRAAGFPAAQVAEIVADSYAKPKVLPGIRRSAAKTIALFERTGVLDIPGAREEFQAAGLLIPLFPSVPGRRQEGDDTNALQ